MGTADLNHANLTGKMKKKVEKELGGQIKNRTHLTKMFEVLIVYLNGFFKILGHHGQSQFTCFDARLEMSKRRNKRIPKRPKREFYAKLYYTHNQTPIYLFVVLEAIFPLE